MKMTSDFLAVLLKIRRKWSGVLSFKFWRMTFNPRLTFVFTFESLMHVYNEILSIPTPFKFSASPPTRPLSTSCPFLSINYDQLKLPICSWVWGHLLEHGVLPVNLFSMRNNSHSSPATNPLPIDTITLV